MKKVSGGTTTLYFYDTEGKVIEKYIPATAAGKDYLWMPKSYEPIARVDFSMTDADTGDVLRCSKSSPNVHLDWSLFSGGGNFVMRMATIGNFSVYSNIFGPFAFKACGYPVLGSTTSYWYDTRDRSLTDTLYFHHFDHLGTAIILLDASGNIVYEQHYAPFGQKDKANTDKKPSSCNNGEEKDSFPYGFTGHFGDDESGLIYMGARYYNPAIGHFMTPDNILPSPTDSLSYDRYAYTRNNPINLIDPTGNFFWAPIIGAVVGGIMAALSGQNILVGMTMGAASGALFGWASGSFWGTVGAGFASGVMNSAVYGGDILRGAVVGAITAGIGYGIGIAGHEMFPSASAADKFGMGVFSALSGGAVGGLSSIAMGGGFNEGFKTGFISAGLSYATNEIEGTISASASGTSSGGDESTSPVTEEQVRNIVAKDLSSEGPIGKFVKSAGIDLDLSKLGVTVINDSRTQSGQMKGEKLLLNLNAINNENTAIPNVSYQFDIRRL